MKNIKGWRDLPPLSTNSSTSTLTSTPLNDTERLKHLDDLFSAVRKSRPQGLLAPLDPPIGTNTEEKEFPGSQLMSGTAGSGAGKAKTAKTTIRQLFTAVGRFQKHLRRYDDFVDI